MSGEITQDQIEQFLRAISPGAGRQVVKAILRRDVPDIIRGLGDDGDDPVEALRFLKNRVQKAEERADDLNQKLLKRTEKRMGRNEARDLHAEYKAEGLPFNTPDYFGNQKQQLCQRKGLTLWLPGVTPNTNATSGQTSILAGNSDSFVFDPTDPLELRRLILRREGEALNLGNPELMKASFSIGIWTIGSYNLIRGNGRIGWPSGEEAATCLVVTGAQEKATIGVNNAGTDALIEVTYECMLVELI